MTAFEWTMISITALGILLTGGVTLAACVWAVATIKQGTIDQITEERTERAAAIAKAMDRFDAAQLTQDHNFGEVGLSLRRFIETVEKEMREIERRTGATYALKDDVKEVRKDIKEMRAEIKSDITTL